MATTREAITVKLPPDRAFDLWTDLTRWPTFVDGFGHVDRIDGDWPQEGAKLVWRSGPAGRGIVTEKVVASEPGERFVTQVFEERMSGAQALAFTLTDDGSTRVDIELDYQLTQGGPLRAITDLLFIRRALTDALRRTLRRFATEAAEEASL
ncbi:MAG TPA: SRPBCC family protein [Thermoleophilaceae bacterium]|nr:SRPBCC family protein [Thermoleophilaceae bacterium]